MRSRNSLMRERQEAFRDARLIVIASEGKDTERIYFKALAKEYTNPRVYSQALYEGKTGFFGSSDYKSGVSVWSVSASKNFRARPSFPRRCGNA